MEDSSNSYLEKRKHERKPIQLPAIYILNGIECPCHIIDISSQGIGMRVKGFLDKGDEVTIILGNQTLKAKVVRVDGNIVGVMFDLLSKEQLDYILSLKTF